MARKTQAAATVGKPRSRRAQEPLDINSHERFSPFTVRPFTANRYWDKRDARTQLFSNVWQAYIMARTDYSSAPQEVLAPIREEILAATSQEDLERINRKIYGVSAEFERIAPQVVESYLREVFNADESLRAELIATGDRKFVNSNTVNRWADDLPKIFRKLRKEYATDMIERASRQDGEPIRVAPQTPLARKLAKETEPYKILTLGVGTRSPEEFYRLIPPGVTHVIDSRRSVPQAVAWSSANNMEANLTLMGIRYEKLPDLSGVTENRSREGDKAIRDYGKWAQGQPFKTALGKVFDTAREASGQVLIVGRAATALYGNCAMLVGQEIEKEGLFGGERFPIAHINANKDGEIYINDNKSTIEHIMGIGERIRLAGGSYLYASFVEDGKDRKFTLAEGVEAVPIIRKEPVEPRLIRGNDNYGAPVNVIPVDGADLPAMDKVPESYIREAVRRSEQAGYNWSDINLIVSVGWSDRELRKSTFGINSGKNIFVNVSGRGEVSVKELLHDPAFIAETAEKIIDKTDEYVTRQSYVNNGEFDASRLRLFVNGSHIAHIANEMKPIRTLGDPDAARDDERNAKSYRTVTSDVTEQDVTDFMMTLLPKIQKKETRQGEFEEGEASLDWAFGEIASNANSGVSISATLAAQALHKETGVVPTVMETPGGCLIWDNETIRGLGVQDPAIYHNRFHMGLHHEVSDAELADSVTRERASREALQGEGAVTRVGLKDMDVLALSLMGFSNVDIIKLTWLAENNGVDVTAAGDFASFLHDSATVGLDHAAYFSEEDVTLAREKAVAMAEKFEARGIGFITVVNPHYPENLDMMEDYSVAEINRVTELRELTKFSETLIRRDAEKAGVLHTENVRDEVQTRKDRSANIPVEETPVADTYIDYNKIPMSRPAILWYKGDLSLLNTPAVSLHGGFTNMDDIRKESGTRGRMILDNSNMSVAMYNDVAESLRDAGVVAVAALGRTSAAAVLSRSTELGAPSVVVCPNGIDAAEYIERKKTKDFGYRENEFYQEVVTEQERDGYMDDMKERILRTGGLLLSEKNPEDKDMSLSDIKRANRIAANISHTALIIDTRPSRTAGEANLAASVEAQTNQYKTFVLDWQLTREASETDRFRTKGNDILIASGAPTVNRRGLSEVTDWARTVYGESKGEYFLNKEQKREDSIAEAEQVLESYKKVEHPRQMSFTVLKYGKERYFAVSEQFPDVREAVRREFGKDVKFIEARDLRALSESLMRRKYILGPRGFEAPARPQIDEPQEVTLYYNEGSIFNWGTAPDGVSGVAPLKDRKMSAEAFLRFRNAAMEIQRKQMESLGLGDSAKPFRFDNADYLVIRPNSVEVREGSTVLARVLINSAGLLAVEQDPQRLNLTEYFNPGFEVFDEELVKRVNNMSSPTAKVHRNSYNPAKDVTDMIEQLRVTIEDFSMSEAAYQTCRTREEKEKEKEELDNGFRTYRENNYVRASNDLAAAELLGLTYTKKDSIGEEISRVEALAYIDREIAALEKTIEKRENGINKYEKVLESGTLKKDESEEKEDDLSNMYSDRNNLIREKQCLMAYRTDVFLAERIVALYDENLKEFRNLDLDGAMVPVTGMKTTRTEVDAEDADMDSSICIEKGDGKVLVAALERLSDRQLASARKEVAAYDAKVLGSSEVLTKLAEDEKNAEKKATQEPGQKGKNPDDPDAPGGGVKVSRDEVIAETQDGVVVEKQGGTKIEADKDLNEKGPLHEDLKTEKEIANAEPADAARVRIICPSGTVKTLTHKDMERLYSADKFIDGWAIIQSEGKYNYLDREFKLMTDKWFDSVTPFNGKGVAEVRRDGKTFKINSGGFILVPADTSMGMGGPGSGK